MEFLQWLYEAFEPKLSQSHNFYTPKLSQMLAFTEGKGRRRRSSGLKKVKQKKKKKSCVVDEVEYIKVSLGESLFSGGETRQGSKG